MRNGKHFHRFICSGLLGLPEEGKAVREPKALLRGENVIFYGSWYQTSGAEVLGHVKHH